MSAVRRGKSRRRGIEPRDVARRWGLKVVAFEETNLRKPHDLAG